MRNFIRIAFTSFKMALQELRVNKLRTFLSLLGISIGIFCIVAVFTALDSLEKNIRDNVASLGNDVIYINKWPWMDEGGEYRWWEYWQRPVLTTRELEAVESKTQTVRIAALCYTQRNGTLRYQDASLSGVVAYAVTPNFEAMQNFEVIQGRYFTEPELSGGALLAVIGDEVRQELFGNSRNNIGRSFSYKGKRITVIGQLKKSGDNMAGFNFDRCIIIPYSTMANIVNVTSTDADPLLMVKARAGISTDDMTYEVEGLLRSWRKVKPGEKNNFSINRLSQVTERLNSLFATIDLIGLVIAFFSLLVGGFGIANIMFVTVRERTKIIGLKKAIGAKKGAILSEFLIEAVTLCIIGGLVGIAFVVVLGAILGLVMDVPIVFSLKNFMFGVSISAIVGILSGYIPARAAARLDPVVAIRSN
jgi:putative ABC transport system permease protein